MLIALLRRQVDPDPAERRLLVSAILLGGNVTVPTGKLVGGSFQNIPACTTDSDTGCVVAYSSFDQTPPADSPARVIWGYIGAYTSHVWLNRDAWILATDVSAGSMCRSAVTPDCSLTVG